MTSERLVCTGCGTDMTDAELVDLRKRDPRVVSCCPERKMVPGVFCGPGAGLCYAVECLERGGCVACGTDA